MACEPLAKLATSTPARLVIHTNEAGRAGPGRFAWVPLRWRALASERPRAHPATPTGVRVEDLQGHQYFGSENAWSLIDLALPAGIYHVMFSWGGLHRRYTVALEDGATVDLHLPLAADRQ